MHSRRFAVAALLCASLSVSAVQAAPTDSVVSQLESLGYQNIKVTRTMLGRARIVAKTRGHAREIILNPKTGEILRDLVDSGSGAKPANVRATETAPGSPKTGKTGNGTSNPTANGGGNSGGNGGDSSDGNGGGNSGGNGGGNSGGNGGGNSGGNGGGNGNGKR